MYLSDRHLGWLEGCSGSLDVSVARFGGLVVLPPSYQRADIQEQFIRDMEIDPERYYPEGYHPNLLESWPTDKAIFIPDSLVPPSMKSAPRGNQSALSDRASP